MHGHEHAGQNNVKYHLVEAEEVSSMSSSSMASSASASGMMMMKPVKMKKGKVQWTQLPLTPSVKSLDGSTNAHGVKKNYPKGRGGRRWKNYAKRFHGGHHANMIGAGAGGAVGQDHPHHQYHHETYVHPQQQQEHHPQPSASSSSSAIMAADLHVTAEWAKTQVEYYFSPDNLVRDTYLRRNMDMDGYVPVGFVAGFQAVYNVHQDYASLLEALKRSDVLEMDVEHEKIRTRDGWQKWLWPNAEGGYGVPRYIKMASREPSHEDEETDRESNN